MAFAMQYWFPVASMATDGRSPSQEFWMNSKISSKVLSLELMAWVAKPLETAKSSFSLTMSTMHTLLAPNARPTAAQSNPIGPAPKTTRLSPIVNLASLVA
ncbi:hypothetical protein OGATHE_002453 [Ogataea polymorpha]|uniref:Uncharacterized protein n=1 Tax=Ogataea polymorpha TaxID=460523 RepID=A0A9P8PD67_9ASCO|nr:hypothetical protein OGATHE_002453 [Ogataea polymorpha]